MVVRRTIEHLRERPKDEKTAIAASIAIGVVAILFVGWLIYFFHDLENTPAPNFQNVTNSLNASGLQQAQSAPSAGGQQSQQGYGSTTQFIDTQQGNIQLQEVGTTSTSYAQ